MRAEKRTPDASPGTAAERPAPDDGHGEAAFDRVRRGLFAAPAWGEAYGEAAR